jgi:hypothetical protein
MRRRYLWLAYLTQAQSKLAAPKGAVAQLLFLSEWMNSWIVTFFFPAGLTLARGLEEGKKLAGKASCPAPHPDGVELEKIAPACRGKNLNALVGCQHLGSEKPGSTPPGYSSAKKAASCERTA